MSYENTLIKALNPLPKAFVDSELVLSTSKNDIHSDGSRFLVFVFTNSKTNIGIRISVSLDSGSVCTSINWKDTSYTEEEYLTYKKRRPEYVANFFSVTIDKYVENLCELIKNEWGDIITGKKWENIPRDWMGYK